MQNSVKNFFRCSKSRCRLFCIFAICNFEKNVKIAKIQNSQNRNLGIGKSFFCKCFMRFGCFLMVFNTCIVIPKAKNTREIKLNTPTKPPCNSLRGPEGPSGGGRAYPKTSLQQDIRSKTNDTYYNFGNQNKIANRKVKTKLRFVLCSL